MMNLILGGIYIIYRIGFENVNKSGLIAIVVIIAAIMFFFYYKQHDDKLVSEVPMKARTGSQ